MKAIKTYIAKTEHIMGYTLSGEETFQQMKYIRMVDIFIIPLIKKLEFGDKIPEELKKVYGRKVVDLSYTFGSEKPH